MNNQAWRDDLRQKYTSLLRSVPAILEQGRASDNDQITTLVKLIEKAEAPAFGLLSRMQDLQDINTDFIDYVIADYIGIQACVLSDQFVSDPDPIMAEFVAEKLAKAQEYYLEFDDEQFELADSPKTEPILTEMFGSKSGAALGGKLNCIGSLLQTVTHVGRMGLSPVPQPQYPSATTSQSSSWAVAPHEIQ